MKPVLYAGERWWHVVTARQFTDQCHRLLLGYHPTVVLAEMERQILNNVCAWIAVCNNTSNHSIDSK